MHKKMNTYTLRKKIRKTLAFFVYYAKINGKLRDLIMWPLASRLLGRSYTETITLKHKGIRFHADMSDIVGRMILFYGEYVDYAWEPRTTKFLEQIISKCNTAIIAGTHIGYTIVYASKAMPENAVIYGFEPVKYLYELSKLNAESFGKRISIAKKALGEKSGQITIHVDGVRSSVLADHKLVGKPVEEVEMTSIDDFINKNSKPQIDLIFLDIEGNEFPTLRGCAKTVLMQEKKPDIIFEVVRPVQADKKGSLNDISVFLKSYGYTLYIIEDDYSSAHVPNNNEVFGKALTPIEEYNGSELYINVYATQNK